MRRPARQKTQPFFVYERENMHRQYMIMVAPFTAMQSDLVSVSKYVTCRDGEVPSPKELSSYFEELFSIKVPPQK